MAETRTPPKATAKSTQSQEEAIFASPAPPVTTFTSKPKAKTTKHVPNTTAVTAFEHLFQQTLRQCNQTAKLDLDIDGSGLPSTETSTTPTTTPTTNGFNVSTGGNLSVNPTTDSETNTNVNGITFNVSNDHHNLVMAKMLNYCIRMLHAHGWHPPTILRAMALQESGLERGLKVTLYQAMRERCDEGRKKMRGQEKVDGQDQVQVQTQGVGQGQGQGQNGMVIVDGSGKGKEKNVTTATVKVTVTPPTGNVKGNENGVYADGSGSGTSSQRRRRRDGDSEVVVTEDGSPVRVNGGRGGVPRST